ncbi:GNAT family N-acetyltransferase [Parasedimentitalea psychrophila]|uniref:L-ornithine N(alpha)-acyltransferase n=1 Tax=Parasedimentitalea psychrophila TaxID=2997337 RepID=A0A9Y2KY11_9RHOB|nr:GNAT family N-acetyltransferase [Parasedimentitalea psychrophila]WIY25226.1 GNAT family N-acyltransferase [Parasedimentitalea psychrophila]
MSKRPEILSRGRYRARFSAGQKDLAAAQALRSLCFGSGHSDLDRFDALCCHILIEEISSADLVCCFRVLQLADGREIPHSYSAQFYGLSRLADYPHPMIEVGRFCSDPSRSDPDVLRLAWAALTRIVDGHGAQMLFGCSSFEGTEVGRHLNAFAVLQQRHLAPERWRPQAKAANLVRFGQLQQPVLKAPQVFLEVPPLLRSYLMMGGWVSDHAVVDTDLNTLHVFTGLEIGAIPASRQRLLRGLAGEF